MNKTINAFVMHIRPLLPTYRVLRKRNSTLMKILNVFLFFVPKFMENFSTTIGSTVYLPDTLFESDSDRIIPILAHEAQHVYDKNQIGNIPYTFLYLFPQILAVCSLLSVLAIWFSNAWLWSLASLAFLAPFPALGRAWVEKRGYLVSLSCFRWMYGESTAFMAINSVTDQFTAKNYYWMWPFEKALKRWFVDNLTLVAETPKAGGPVYDSAHTFIQKRRQM